MNIKNENFTLPFQGTDASSQHKFHESQRFPHLHSET